MASLNFTNLQQMARDDSQDNDANSANYSIGATVLAEVINRFISQYRTLVEGSPQDLSATTTGLTFTAGTGSVDTSVVNITRIVDLYLTAAAGTSVPAGLPLERCRDYELAEWFAAYAQSGVDLITRYSAMRLGDATKTAGNVGRWRIRVHPAPFATAYLLARAVVEPATLSGANDVPDLSLEEGYGIAKLAGAWMSRRIGRDDAFIQSILAEVPASMQAMTRFVGKFNPPAVQASQELP